jgi:hypothetical protein
MRTYYILKEDYNDFLGITKFLFLLAEFTETVNRLSYYEGVGNLPIKIDNFSITLIF